VAALAHRQPLPRRQPRPAHRAADRPVRTWAVNDAESVCAVSQLWEAKGWEPVNSPQLLTDRCVRGPCVMQGLVHVALQPKEAKY